MKFLVRFVSVLLAPIFLSCQSDLGGKKDFYTTFSEDWDYDIIPLVQPYKLGSTDGRYSWRLASDSTAIFYHGKPGSGIGAIKQFGISKNYIIGQDNETWFLFDIQTELYAYYKTKQELVDCLNSFNIPVPPIKNCKEYEEDIKKTGKCYWFPEKEKKYAEKLQLKPRDIMELNIITTNENIKLELPESIVFQQNKIYFFKFNINQHSNDLLYFAINWTYPILIKKNYVVPIFIDEEPGGSFEITLYTPYPVAVKKGIPEDKRTHIKRLIKIE